MNAAEARKKRGGSTLLERERAVSKSCSCSLSFTCKMHYQAITGDRLTLTPKGEAALNVGGIYSEIPGSSKGKPTFERCADATLDEVKATYSQRGGEYGDSWHVENVQTRCLDAILVLLNLTVAELTVEQKRLIVMASLVDVKESRLIGPWKKDTLIDSIAYRAALAALVEEYQAK